MGHRSAPPRHEPFHGAADFLLLCRRHGHLHHARSVHRHDRADEREGQLNTHEVISELFRAMNTKAEGSHGGRHCPLGECLSLRERRAVFGHTDVPRFSKIARSYLIHIGSLDWTKINPTFSAR